MTFPSAFFVHTASVRTPNGRGPTGPTFHDAVTVRCFLDDGQDVTVQGTTLAVAESAKLYASLSTAPTTPAMAGQLAPDAEVIVNGRTVRVASVRVRSAPGLGLPEHVEATLR